MPSLHRRIKKIILILLLSVGLVSINLNGNGNNWLQIILTGGRSTTECKNVLLFSYMRSGSSVTGNLLRDSPGVFFMFEPLSPLAPYSYFTDSSVCEMRNSTCRTKNARDRIGTALTALVNLYSCNLSKVPISLIYKMAQEGKSGKAWLEYGACLNGTKARDQQNSNGIDTSMHCLNRLEQACISADRRVAKVLRLGFSTVEQLLNRLPTLKVLYLTRDPRAIINSRIKTEWFPVFKEKPGTVSNNILSLCLKMKTDIMSWIYTDVLYKDRILHTTLNKLASRMTVMSDVYKFIHKKVTGDERQKIITFLHGNKANNYTEKWRTELHPAHRKRVENQCGYVIQRLTEL